LGADHPRVEATSRVISLEVKGNNDYFGPLYVGSNYEQTSMIYDTTSSWITVN
jgi:hypothetical protein